MAKRKNEESKNKEKQQKMTDENVLYEIKFVETADGYRLEASGDKALLHRLGIGPRMLGGRKRPGRHAGKRRMLRRRAGQDAFHSPWMPRNRRPRRRGRWDDLPGSVLF